LNGGEILDVTDVSDQAKSPIPGAKDRPRFSVIDDWLDHGGASSIDRASGSSTHDKDGNPAQSWICSPMHVDAVTFDGQRQSTLAACCASKTPWGAGGNGPCRWICCAAAGDDLRGELLAWA
jgi:putative DNA primase/helicase